MSLFSRLSLLLAAALLALAGAVLPELPMRSQIFRYLFVFDISQSMNVADGGSTSDPQTRLAAARDAVATFLGGAPCGSQAALGIFSGHRTFLLLNPVEVCENYQELAEILGGINWHMAWKARSEVSKGLDSALLIAKRMEDELRLVFFTDGHEAPPINDLFPPKTRAEPGDVGGIIVGVGGTVPSPIPKLDRKDRLLGYWQHHEVMQVDPYVLGRNAGVTGEGMVGVDRSDLKARIASGTEHLSTLRERYLQERAAQTALRYHRLTDPQALAERLRQSEFAVQRTAPVRLHWVPALLALGLLVGMYLRSAVVMKFRRKR